MLAIIQSHRCQINPIKTKRKKKMKTSNKLFNANGILFVIIIFEKVLTSYFTYIIISPDMLVNFTIPALALHFSFLFTSDSKKIRSKRFY